MASTGNHWQSNAIKGNYLHGEALVGERHERLHVHHERERELVLHLVGEQRAATPLEDLIEGRGRSGEGSWKARGRLVECRGRSVGGS